MEHHDGQNPAEQDGRAEGSRSTAPAEHRFRVDHSGFIVPDLGAAVAFFSEHLGAELVFEIDRFIDESGQATRRMGDAPDASFALAMVRIGDARLELLQWWPESPAPHSPHAVGSAHLALSVRDVTEAYERLGSVPGVRKLGSALTFEGEPTDGLTNAFVATPWGLLIELMAWPADAGR